jgi:hypothetical protein
MRKITLLLSLLVLSFVVSDHLFFLSEKKDKSDFPMMDQLLKGFSEGQNLFEDYFKHHMCKVADMEVAKDDLTNISQTMEGLTFDDNLPTQLKAVSDSLNAFADKVKDKCHWVSKVACWLSQEIDAFSKLPKDDCKLNKAIHVLGMLRVIACTNMKFLLWRMGRN